ncbi:hypothetical protein CVT25_007790 [Psilocybe cyanescens]|uniref:Uncharacterized protein n=1 Tax=Psilocybe cyanescens TaxID=93625 RepID=A0A409XI00_PSICY|nr:hypothetical protein CVT25_007790 [Psilocybe cyanescens]
MHPEQPVESDRDYVPDGRFFDPTQRYHSQVKVLVINDNPQPDHSGVRGSTGAATMRWQVMMHELENDGEEIGHSISRHLREEDQKERVRSANVGVDEVVVVGEGEGEDNSDAWASDVDLCSVWIWFEDDATHDEPNEPRQECACSCSLGTPPVSQVARPGTADSFVSFGSNSSTIASVAVGALSLRHDVYAGPRNQHLENIHTTSTTMQSVPGTRESSLSCNVQFVDYAAQGRPGSSMSVAADLQQVSQLQLAPVDISIGGGGEDDGQVGSDEERKDWCKNKRRFRRKGGNVSGAELGDDIV